jgi:hypothetical protein
MTTPSETRRYLAATLAICITVTIVTVGVVAYVLNSTQSFVAAPRAQAPNRETAMADLPGLPQAVRWDLVMGLNAEPVNIPAVVSGQTPLQLTAAPTEDKDAQDRHAVALQFSGLNRGGVSRATVWVKSANTKLQLQVRDSQDTQTGKSPNAGEVQFNLKTRSTTVAYGNLLAQGIDITTDGWNKVWVDLKSADGNVFVLLGLLGEGGTDDTFTGTGEHVLLGGIEVAPKP